MNNSKKGLALSMVLILGLILTIMGFAFLYLSREERSFSHKNIYPASAFWIAEAGAEHGKAWLEKELPPNNWKNPYRYGEPFQPFEEQQFDIGKYSVTITPPSIYNPGGYLIDSVGSVDVPTEKGTKTITKKIKINATVRTFARFAYYSNNETRPGGDTIWFTDNDILYGPIHSNSRINIRGKPTFHGRVTSTASSFNYYSGVNNNPQFNAGYKLGAREISMNEMVNMQDLKDAAIDEGIYINVDKTLNPSVPVTLNGHTVTYSYVEKYMDGKKEKTRTVTRSFTIDTFGVIYSTNNISIQGPVKNNKLTDAKVHDHLTIATEGNMLIKTKVLYNTRPDNPSCTGMLGLVASNSIKVASDAPNNMEIHATIMSFNDSFSVENYNSGSSKGTLTIWGGIIQQYRGAVGTFNSKTGAQLTGYVKNYHYDDRVTAQPPPVFPLIKINPEDPYYRIDSWEELSS